MRPKEVPGGVARKLRGTPGCACLVTMTFPLWSVFFIGFPLALNALTRAVAVAVAIGHSRVSRRHDALAVLRLLRANR